MSFWENVEYIREYRNLSRKELAYQAKFSQTSISTGIKRESVPAADVAYRIAKVLKVSIEYLLTGKDDANAKNEIPIQFHNFKKYSALFEEFDKLPASAQKKLVALLKDIRLGNK